MKYSVEVYDLILEVETPVFIGNGKNINKKEYIILPGKKLGVLDVGKFYYLVCKKHKAEEFERFMLQKTKSDFRLSLNQWMERSNIRIEDVKECFKYILDSESVTLLRGTPLEIFPFIKDPYGQPYVPGSSVKGMIRTILMGADICQNPKYYYREAELIQSSLNDRQKQRQQYILSRESSKLESKRYHWLRYNERREDAVNDLMSGLIISDSEPLRIEDMVVCQRLEVYTDGREKRMNVLRECIRPGTKIRCRLTLDHSRVKQGKLDLRNDIKAGDVLSAASVFSRQYFDNYLKKFPSKMSYMPDRVFLGGGIGFVSKTVVYPLFPGKRGIKITQQIFKKKGISDKHMHSKDMEYGVSPHILKCTNFSGKTVPFGACRMKLERTIT